MNRLMSILAGVLLFSSVSAFAADTPECSYWKSQLEDINTRLTDAQARLQACKQDCGDLQNLVDSLNSEKSSDESFVADFCQN